MEQITHDFKLPNHCNELSYADDIIEKLKAKIKRYEDQSLLTDKEHHIIFEEIIRVLDYVGRLSIPAFNIEEEVKNQYYIRYSHSPELAKKLWLDHFENIHHPYNILKNRCFKLIDELDELYVKIYSKNPPNWR